MIYKLIVNAAFLAIGYYIGKEVAVRESGSGKSGGAGMSPSRYAGKAGSGQNAKKQRT